MIGEFNNTSTDEAATVLGSFVDSRPDAIFQPVGRSRVTCAGADVWPTTYMNECRSPMSPPLGERNGLHAGRIVPVSPGRGRLYFKLSSPLTPSTRHNASSSFEILSNTPFDLAVRFST